MTTSFDAVLTGLPRRATPTARGWVDRLTTRAHLRTAGDARTAQPRRVTRAMTTLSRLGAGIITTVLAAVLAGAPAADAATNTVSPGDLLDYVSPTTGTQHCTIGDVYRGKDRHTYAVTAGHCRSTADGYARDQRSGLTGSFVRAIAEPPRSGGADYGLIDFGSRSWPGYVIGDTPTTDDHPQPQVGESMCRMGVSSGQQCGQIVATHGDEQYLTAGMPESMPGDSGGPVWIHNNDGRAHIIGIWLGEKITATKTVYGRFASLATGLRLLDAD